MGFEIYLGDICSHSVATTYLCNLCSTVAPVSLFQVFFVLFCVIVFLCIHLTASTSLGVPMVEEELRLVAHIAQETRRNQRAANKARNHVEKLAVAIEPTKELAPVVGPQLRVDHRQVGGLAGLLGSPVGDPRVQALALAAPLCHQDSPFFIGP